MNECGTRPPKATGVRSCRFAMRAPIVIETAVCDRFAPAADRGDDFLPSWYIPRAVFVRGEADSFADRNVPPVQDQLSYQAGLVEKCNHPGKLL